MENFDQIFTLLAEHEGISLNLDILETGLLNILALLAILIYVGRDFLGSLLETRQAEIITAVQDAEERLNEANKRLAEAQKQLTQADVIFAQIKEETLNTKKLLLKADSDQSRKDLSTRFSRAIAALRSKELQVYSEIKKQIITLVLKRTVIRAQETFGPKPREIALINDNINKLEGQFLLLII
jgi:F-type H+-transporting ATPase subunit b